MSSTATLPAPAEPITHIEDPGKILVTGAAGFIGSHLSTRLLESGFEVVGLDNFDAFYDPRVKESNLEAARDFRGFTELRSDIRDPFAYASLPDGIDTVIHLAARAGVRPSIEEPVLYADVNLAGTARLLECMRHRGVTRILFGSSSSVYGNDTPAPFSESAPADRPISPYAATKRAGELLVRSYAHLFGIDAICLRFFTVYGPRQRPDLAIHKFTGLMSRGSPIPVFGDGRSERDYTEIEDILDGVEAALAYVRANPGTYEVVNLGSSRTISLRRMIDEIASALGVRVRTVHLGDQAGDVRRTFADVSKARRLLGYRPSVPFDAGIRRFVDWFLSQPTRARAAS